MFEICNRNETVRISLQRCFAICERITGCHCIEQMYLNNQDYKANTIFLKKDLILEYAMALPKDHGCRNPIICVDTCNKPLCKRFYAALH